MYNNVKEVPTGIWFAGGPVFKSQLGQSSSSNLWQDLTKLIKQRGQNSIMKNNTTHFIR